MAMNYIEGELRASRDPHDQERADIISAMLKARGKDIDLPQVAGTPKETTLIRIRGFSPEEREAAKGIGLVVVEFPTPQSIRTLRESGHKFWSTWHEAYSEFEALASKYSEVAFDPKQLFLPNSNNKTLAQQDRMVADYSKGITKKIPGVEAVIGEAPDYVNLAFGYLDQTDGKEYLFGEKYDYNYARTKTRTVGGGVASVGPFNADYGLGVGYWRPDDGFGNIFVAPLVVPKS